MVVKMENYKLISPAEFGQKIPGDLTILDVRSKDEHEELHLKAKHEFVPLDELSPTDFLLQQGIDKDAPICIVCLKGIRSRKAAEKFLEAGYKNIIVVDGGLEACIDSGLPIERNLVAHSSSEKGK